MMAATRLSVLPGRALRLSGEAYPLFRPPDPASVADPGDCIDFLKALHLSLCPVFDIRLRRWMGRYFDAVLAQVDARPDCSGADRGSGPDGLTPCLVLRRPPALVECIRSNGRGFSTRYRSCFGAQTVRWRSALSERGPGGIRRVLSSETPILRPRPRNFWPHWATTLLNTGAMSPPRGTRLCAAPFRGCAGNGSDVEFEAVEPTGMPVDAIDDPVFIHIDVVDLCRGDR